MFNDVATRAILFGGAYGATALMLGRDTASRAFSYIPTLGADLVETALDSLVAANFISPLSKEALVKARYIGTVCTGALAFWKGPEFLKASSDLFVIDMIGRPFKIKQYGYNHPNRMLLTKQQTAALGATVVISAAVIAGPDRTAWAIDQLREVPAHAADSLLASLNLTKDGWFSSASRPTWAKWAVGVPLVAGGWIVVNTLASGILSGVNRLLKGVQTPIRVVTYEDLYRDDSAIKELRGKYYGISSEKLALELQLDEEKRRTQGWKEACFSLIQNIAPGLREKLEGLSHAALEIFKKEQTEQTEKK